jgi:type II secretory pathway component GspD/PulD (secretin)
VYKAMKSCISLSILIGIILGCLFVSRNFAQDSQGGEKLARLTPQEIEQNEKDRQDAINAFVKEGTELFKKGKYIEAKVQFEKALKLDATQPQALDYLKKCDTAIANKKNPKQPAPVVKQETKPQEAPSVAETKAQKEQEEKQKQEEQKRLAEEKKAAEQKAKEEAAAKKQQQAEELAAQKKAKEEQIAADKAAKQKAEEEKIAADKAAKEKAKADAEAKKQQQAEELAAQKKAKEEQIAAEKAAQKKAEEEKIAQEKAAKETAPKTEADRIAAEKAAKEKAKADAEAKKQQQAEELAAQKKAKEEQIAAEKAAQQKEKEDAIAAQKKAEEDKIAADKAAKEKAKADAEAKKQQQAEELAAQKKAKEEQIAAEKAAKQKEKEDAIAAQKKAEEDKIAAEKAEKEKAKAEAEAKKQQQVEELAAQQKAADEKKTQEMAAKKAEEEQRIAADNAVKEKAKEEAAARKLQHDEEVAAQKKAEEDKIAADKAAKEKARQEELARKEEAKQQEQERIAAEEAAKKAQQEKLAQAKEQQPAPAPASSVTVDTKKQVRDGLNRGKQLYKSNKTEDLTQSIQEFQQVLAIDPGNSEAIRYLNLAQTKLEKQEQAAAKQSSMTTPVVQTQPQSPVLVTQSEQPVVAVADASQTSPQPSTDTISNDEKARQEALKRADEEEKRVRAEREREDSAKKATEAEDHYKAGMTYLNQGQILKAHDEWETVLALVPNHQGAQSMIEETRAQYEAALDVQRKEQEAARVEAENEKKMNDPIITIDVADQEIGDVLTQMGAVVGFNMVIGEGVKAKVSASFTNVSLKKALDTLLPINGFKYIRQGDIIQVSLDLRTKIYPLTDDQVKKLRFAMVEDKILQRELYGPDAKPKVPGQELTLDEQAHLLSITDSKVNIDKLDEFLQNLPPIRAEELITRVYTLRQGDAEDIRKLVQAVLSASPVKGIPDEERKVILEPGSNTLVIRDSIDNLKKVEEFLTDKHFLEKLTNQELITKVYHLSSEENSTTPDALARKAELVNNVGEVLETMLYASEGREKAYEENRRIFKDPRFGTITVVDTQDNQRKIEEYVAQLPTGQEQKLLSKVFPIHNADPDNLRNVINQIIQESRSSAGGGGTVGDYVDGTISEGAGNGLTFLDVTVELIDVNGANGARLYIYTPTRDREVTLTVGNSELVDEYRVRLIKVNVPQKEADIEIRLASFTAQNRAVGNFTTPGYGQAGAAGTLGAAGVGGAPGAGGAAGTTPQAVYRKPTIRVDTDTNSIIVLAFDPNDMSMIEDWITKLDVPILQVSIEAKFVDVNETEAKEMGIDWLVPSLSNWGSFKPVTDQLSFGATVPGYPDPVNASVSQDPLIADLRNNSLMSGGTLFQFQTVGGLQMTLDTLEAQGVINIISSPRVTVVNQQPANMTVTEQFPYLTPAAITFPATGVPQYNGVGWSFESVVISINVTPTIHADGSIILSFSSPSAGGSGIEVDKVVDRVPEEALLGSQILNYLSPNSQQNTDYGQPIIDTRNITTQVRVKDGSTIVMGGLIEETDKTSNTQVPLLGDIPVLGYLFKKSFEEKVKDRLFMFLTATIVP